MKKIKNMLLASGLALLAQSVTARDFYTPLDCYAQSQTFTVQAEGQTLTYQCSAETAIVELYNKSNSICFTDSVGHSKGGYV